MKPTLLKKTIGVGTEEGDFPQPSTSAFRERFIEAFILKPSAKNSRSMTLESLVKQVSRKRTAAAAKKLSALSFQRVNPLLFGLPHKVHAARLGPVKRQSLKLRVRQFKLLQLN